jgi:flagellar basal-body rod protein FlgG
MIRGVYTAAAAMLVQETAQAVIANNLANANTPGYKADVATFESFRLGAITRARGGAADGAPAGGIGEIGAGATTSEIAPDLGAGSLKRTNNPLDVALRAPNQFFTVRAPQGDRLTRAGSFALAADGALTDTAGFPVVGGDGRPVRVDPAAAGGGVSIDGQGNLVVGGAPVARLAVVELVPGARPVKEGDRLLRADAAGGAAATRPAARPALVTESLEMSNVSIVEEMVAMIGAMRAYEAAQKAVQSHDQALAAALTQVAGRAG